MRRTLIILTAIVVLQLLGCASPAQKTLVLRAQGQVAGQAVGHAVHKPILSGFDAAGTASASVCAECHVTWQ